MDSLDNIHPCAHVDQLVFCPELVNPSCGLCKGDGLEGEGGRGAGGGCYVGAKLV